MQAVTCPICLGCGVEEIKDSKYTYYNKRCHGCEGKGWVSVPDEEGLFISDYMRFDSKKDKKKEA